MKHYSIILEHWINNEVYTKGNSYQSMSKNFLAQHDFTNIWKYIFYNKEKRLLSLLLDAKIKTLFYKNAKISKKFFIILFCLMKMKKQYYIHAKFLQYYIPPI